ncbi:MAG TPA: BON domain-containing protein [Candidatus Dormibacteraeota bacterium]|nr:BON domain-containing protein [Candidatus Dormibacteraeota bacterium]
MLTKKFSHILLYATLGAGFFFVSCNRPLTDDNITTEIKSQLYSDPVLRTASVQVASNSGVVTLTGQVPDEAARQSADNLASRTAGVKQVIDQLVVAAPQAAYGNNIQPSPTVPADTNSSGSPDRGSRNQAEQRRIQSERNSSRRDRSEARRNNSEQDRYARERQQDQSNRAADQPYGNAATPQYEKSRTVTIPSNTIVTVLTIDGIDSTVNRTGQTFAASLDAPVVVNDNVVIPKGANATLKLVSASSAGHMTGRSELTLALDSIAYQGRTYHTVSSDVRQAGSSRTKRTAETVGGGAVLGAIIGGIAGGGKGAAIGAAAGGGAGAGVQILTHAQQVKVPPETRLDFTLQQPLEITYVPGRRSRRDSTGSSSSNPSSYPADSSSYPEQQPR